MKHLFSDENTNIGIFGEMIAHYGIVETQNRGTLHIHLLIWIRNCPNSFDLFDRMDSDMEFQKSILAYVSSIISTGKALDDSSETEIDNKIQYKQIINLDEDRGVECSEHLLQQCTKTYQLHNHTPSCSKNTKIGGCRYRKPDRIVQETKWNASIGNIDLAQSNGMINNFNPWLTGIVNSNTDIQYIMSGIIGLSIVHYMILIRIINNFN